MIFEQWYAHVDAEFQKRLSLGAEDFPDQIWRDWYEQGLTPHQAVEKALFNEYQAFLAD